MKMSVEKPALPREPEYRYSITVHTRNVAQTQRTARKMTGTDASSRISDEIFELSLQTFASSH